jgi:cytoskeletal protein CcmA (bactofilin family)
MPRAERVSAKMGRVMSTTRHTLPSWRRDLSLFISQVWRGVARKVPMWDSKNQKTLGGPKLEPRDLQTNPSRLGPSLLVKGEISGNGDLFIDGTVEGVVRLNERTLLMIGPRANVKADITAGEVVVRGNLKGNILARGRIEVRNDGSVTGDLTTPQVFIEEGASFKGSIEIEKSTENETALSGSEIWSPQSHRSRSWCNECRVHGKRSTHEGVS